MELKRETWNGDEGMEKKPKVGKKSQKQGDKNQKDKLGE